MSDPFTKAELAAILKGLSRAMSGKYGRAEYEAVMAWATDARLNADVLDMVVQGYLDVYVDGDGVVRFIETDVGLQSSRRHELERIRM